MAKKFILENLVKLAQGIGANPTKFMGTKTNISFLGKGPTSNILFQNPVRIKNYLRNRGSDESVLGEINDAMGFATAGKLNPIQLEILNDNLIKIATIMKPSALPSLPSASVTNIAPGITGVKRLIKEGKIEDAWRKFDKGYKGNPADEKYFESFHPEAYKDSTKSKPFTGWTPSVVPKANIPASKINHQMIADKYGINVELIEGKDWVEVLEILRKLGRYAEGGRIGFFQGALADTKEGKAMSPGTSADYTPGAGHRTGGDGQGGTTQTNLIPSPITHGESDQMNLEKFTSPSFNVKYSPAKAAMLRARIYNQNLLESDDINVEGSLSGTAGNFNYDVPFSDRGIQGVNLNYGNFSTNIDPNKNINMAFNKNIGGWNTGVNYDSDGNLMATIGTKFNKGGLAGILEV